MNRIEYLCCSEIVQVYNYMKILVIVRDNLLHGDYYQCIDAQGKNAWFEPLSKFSLLILFDESMGGTKSPHQIIRCLTYLVAFCSYLAKWAFFRSWVKLPWALRSKLSVPPSSLSRGGSHMWERWRSLCSILWLGIILLILVEGWMMCFQFHHKMIALVIA